MKKNFTLKKSLLVAAMAFIAVGAQAQQSGFYHVPLWGQLKAYPENGGKVYAEMLNKSNIAPEGNDYAEPATSKDLKFTARVYVSSTTTDIVGNYRAYAVPNEGWVFAGFAVAEYVDNEPNPPATANPKWSKSPQSLAVTSQGYTKDNLFATSDEALKNFPAEVDMVHYALFTHVTVSADALFYTAYGSATIDKAANDIGQEITITAVPNKDLNAKFSHWVEESTGKEIKENPYTFTVSGIDNYKAVFTSDNVFTIDFPEEGGYVEFYRENEINFLETVEHPIFMGENMKKHNQENGFFNKVDKYRNFIDPKIATFLYGKGTQMFLDIPTNTKTGLHNGLEKWSGKDGVKLDTMKVTIYVDYDRVEKDNIRGYLLDKESNTFKRVTDGMVPANRVFLAVPQYYFDEIEEGFLPDVIYLSEEEAEAASVDGVQVDKTVKNGKTYTLDGKQVAAPKQKGIYIYDGKKLIFRK